MSADGIVGPEAEATEAIEQVTISPKSTQTIPSALETTNRSALEDNIDQKGKHAYYFAHAHKANGPKWDGKAQPRLLSSRSLSTAEQKMKTVTSSFEYTKSNITSYAFSDDGKSVKLYITMEEVGDKCSDDDISLDSSENSFSLVIRNYQNEPQCLSFGKLAAKISRASYKKKKDKIIVTLTKEKEGIWQTINDKGAPDHELL
jgi:hypothetical protein